MNEIIIKHEEYTVNTRNKFILPNMTTMEKLAGRVNATEGAVLKFGDHVLVTDRVWGGFMAGVYEFLETPEEADCDECECRLNLIGMSTDTFADGGHAIMWAASV